MNDNRRQTHRTPIEGEHAFGQLLIGNDRIPVLISDESIGGLGVVALNLPELAPGMSVEFESTVRHANSRVGSVRHVRLSDSDVYRIGLEWND